MLGGDECINAVPLPVVRGAGNIGAHRHSECPVIAWIRLGLLIRGRGSMLFDPRPEQCDLLCRQRLPAPEACGMTHHPPSRD